MYHGTQGLIRAALKTATLFTALLPLWCHAAITQVGVGTAAAAAGGSNVSPSIHASTTTGDAIIVQHVITHDQADGAAFTDNATGYTLLEVAANEGAANSVSMAVYCRIATGADTYTHQPASGGGGTGDVHIAKAYTFRGTFNDCSQLVAHTNEGTAATTGIPHVALTVTTANSVVIVFGGKRTGWASVDTLTTDALGWAELGDDQSTTGDDVGLTADYIIQTTATSIGTGTFTVVTPGTAGAPSVSIALSLKEAVTCSGTPTITDVDTDESVTHTQANVVIAGTTFCAAQGGGSVTLRQSGNSKTLSIDSWSDTSIQVDISGVGPGVADGLIDGSADLRVTNDAANTDDQAITLTPPSGTTCTTLSGGLATLTWDSYGNPSRLFGDPIDLLAASQVCIRNIQGTGSVTVNADASLTISDGVTAFDWDYTDDDGSGSSHLFIGTVSTWGSLGIPPCTCGLPITDHVLAVGLAMQSYDLDDYFVAGDGAASARAMRQLGSATDTTTDVNGAVTASLTVVVDDASVLLDDVGGWVRFGASGTPVRLKYADPLTNTLGLWSVRSAADNDSVFTIANGAGSVSQVTVNSGTGAVSGTPDTDATTTSLVYRWTADDTLFTESQDPFQIDVVTIPDVTADDLATGQAALEALGIVVNTSFDCTLAEAANEILTQMESSVLFGTESDLVVSLGDTAERLDRRRILRAIRRALGGC